ncbi:MAG: ABC transporter permease subunit [Sporolactobacillus sp.]|uniref:ABC transporter permease subunit n=1 Tax=Sporolactobacillus sp. STSJ-5 TaxID=2965076 RepID=UPI00210475A8|nr:ABC transporter permease subunit [Sporolactobacillus sp. STSJ-5]MCQ2010274.1 ABC transporter permease subunit [Sporolactobacillus sp. STSJ-5]
MNGFTAFFKKELLEAIRNYRVLILFSVTAIFGMMSPLTAKMMPDILANVGVEGMVLKIPEPTFIDAFTQFFKNFSQMGTVVLLLVFGGLLSQDLAKGTLIIPLSKGLSRHAVILAKYASALTLWTLSYALATLINYGYTLYFFQTISVSHLFFSLFCLWLFGAFLLAFLLLASVVTRGAFGGLLVTAAGLGILLICQAIFRMDPFNPLKLVSENVALLTGKAAFDQLLNTAWSTCALILSTLILAMMLFKKKSI